MDKGGGLSRLAWVGVWVVAWSPASGATLTAQASSPVKEDFRLWSPVYVTVPLSPSFIGYMEVNPRFADNVSELDQLFFRPALGYKLTDHLSIWQGYAWIGSYRPRFIGEHRSFQQVIYSRKFSFLKLLSRPGWKNASSTGQMVPPCVPARYCAATFRFRRLPPGRSLCMMKSL